MIRTGQDEKHSISAITRWAKSCRCKYCHVGCCDSSKNKHASAHFAETEHPLVKSLQQAESWGWCYQDQTYL
jgi:hypothetical protein